MFVQERPSTHHEDCARCVLQRTSTLGTPFRDHMHDLAARSGRTPGEAHALGALLVLRALLAVGFADTPAHFERISSALRDSSCLRAST